jgi:CheY-like chemotaxis protein
LPGSDEWNFAQTPQPTASENKKLALGRCKASIREPMGVPVLPTKKILVVDDEPFVCDAVKMMLTFDGHEVQTASSGKEALASLNKERFDLVITDFAMPAMKGDELASTIKTLFPGQPVIMITAYAEMLQSSGAPLVGVDRLISKPFLLDDLREAIAEVLLRKTA